MRVFRRFHCRHSAATHACRQSSRIRDGLLYEGAAGRQEVARGVAMPASAIFRLASMTRPAHASGIGDAFTDPAFNRALRDSKPREPDSAA